MHKKYFFYIMTGLIYDHILFFLKKNIIYYILCRVCIFFLYIFVQKKSLFFPFNFETSHMPAKSQISPAQILFTVVIF